MKYTFSGHESFPCKALWLKKGYDFIIEVDGGVNASNIVSVAESGADLLVAGSAVFKNDVYKNAKELMELIGQ